MALKVIEDLSYVVLLRKKFSYIESIPGVLLPHPSSSAFPYKVDEIYGTPESWHYHNTNIVQSTELHGHVNQVPLKITPSMSSLEALLSKLPSVVPPPQSGSGYFAELQPQSETPYLPMEYMDMEKAAKEEIDEDHRGEDVMGESSSSMSAYRRRKFQN